MTMDHIGDLDQEFFLGLFAHTPHMTGKLVFSLLAMLAVTFFQLRTIRHSFSFGYVCVVITAFLCPGFLDWKVYILVWLSQATCLPLLSRMISKTNDNEMEVHIVAKTPEQVAKGSLRCAVNKTQFQHWALWVSHGDGTGTRLDVSGALEDSSLKHRSTEMTLKELQHEGYSSVPWLNVCATTRARLAAFVTAEIQDEPAFLCKVKLCQDYCEYLACAISTNGVAVGLSSIFRIRLWYLWHFAFFCLNIACWILGERLARDFDNTLALLLMLDYVELGHVLRKQTYTQQWSPVSESIKALVSLLLTVAVSYYAQDLVMLDLTFTAGLLLLASSRALCIFILGGYRQPMTLEQFAMQYNDFDYLGLAG